MTTLTAHLGAALCQTYGINPNECTRLEIVFDARDPKPFAVAHLVGNEKVACILMSLRTDAAVDIEKSSHDDSR